MEKLHFDIYIEENKMREGVQNNLSEAYLNYIRTKKIVTFCVCSKRTPLIPCCLNYNKPNATNYLRTKRNELHDEECIYASSDNYQKNLISISEKSLSDFEEKEENFIIAKAKVAIENNDLSDVKKLRCSILDLTSTKSDFTIFRRINEENTRVVVKINKILWKKIREVSNANDDYFNVEYRSLIEKNKYKPIGIDKYDFSAGSLYFLHVKHEIADYSFKLPKSEPFTNNINVQLCFTSRSKKYIDDLYLKNEHVYFLTNLVQKCVIETKVPWCYRNVDLSTNNITLIDYIPNKNYISGD